MLGYRMGRGVLKVILARASLILLVASGLLLAFQNCSGQQPNSAMFYSNTHEPFTAPSVASLLSANSIPKIEGFNPGAKPGEPYRCQLETESQDLIYRGAIQNRVQFNQNPGVDLSTLQYELVGVYGDYRQSHVISGNTRAQFQFELPAFDSHVYYYVRSMDANLRVLCTTPVALVRKKPATCSLQVAQSLIYPGQSASFSLKHNVGHLQQSISASWVTSYNGQLIETGMQGVNLMSLSSVYSPGSRTGHFSRGVILRDQSNNAEICRTSNVSFKALTAEEANRNLGDISSPRDPEGSSGIPVGGGTGGSGGGASDPNRRSAEEREWCQATQTQVQCQVTRTYCSGVPPLQSTVTDEVPIIERHTVTLPRRAMATFLDNYLEFSDTRYQVMSLRSRYFCNPDSNPQWQFQSYYGFRCQLSIDLRPPRGCDSSGFN